MMGTGDDSAHLPLTQYVLHGYHRYGHPVNSEASWSGRGGMAICYSPQGDQQLLEQLPTSKLLDNEPVLDQTAVGQRLQVREMDMHL